MFKFYNFILLLFILYSCSPINKQHGYLLDDFLVSSEKISKFEVKNTTKNDVFDAMGSPSIEIQDVENVWIYLLSLKEKKRFLMRMNYFIRVFIDLNLMIVEY